MPVEPTIQAEVALAISSFRWNEAEYEKLLRIDVMKDLVRRAIRIEAHAKSSMGQTAPPSAPGQPPAVRTGRLRASITWRPGQDATSPYVDVGTNVFYAVFVELGTSQMAARPYLRPAMRAAAGDF